MSRRSFNPSRSPFARLGWHEYVADTPPRREGERLVLLISNSQGHGSELPADRIYAHLLNGKFRSSGHPVRVVNWSVPGVRYHDFLVLASLARRVDPSHIIVVSTPGMFVYQEPFSDARGSWGSDLYTWLAERRLRADMPDEDRQVMTDFGLEVDIAMSRLWPAWRARHIPSMYGGELRRVRRYQALQEGGAAGVHRDPKAFREPPPDLPGLPRRRAEVFLDLVAAGGAPVTFVRMPLHPVWRDHDAQAWTALEALCRDHRVATRDLSSAVPGDGFLTPSHLNADGHRIFAGRMMEFLP